MTADASTTLATRLAGFAADTRFEALPEAVVASVRDRVLDTLGIELASSGRGLGEAALEVARERSGTPRATAVGGEALAAGEAAFVNGVLAHSLDFDDTHLPSVLHPSASIVPACLAAAEAAGASDGELITAIAVGIEITVRLGVGGYADGVNHFFERGWHATSICGTLGAAASAARLRNLDPTATRDAIGIAASMAAGLLEANRSGGTVKRLHCGIAARAGIEAAQLAAAGYTAPPSVLEGRFGFYQAYLDGAGDQDAVTADLGTRWELPDIHVKPYPCNHYTHAGIDAALEIRARRVIDPEHITRIELGAAGPALRTIGEPRGEKIRPQSGYHAQFSGPFTVAAALLGGGGLGLWLDDFTDERARDPRLLALAERVETFVDPACDDVFPRAFPAVLRIHFDDGSVEEARVMENRGGPARPLSADELRRKFELNAGLVLPAAAAAELAAIVRGLGTNPAAHSAARLLASTRAAAAPARS